MTVDNFIKPSPGGKVSAKLTDEECGQKTFGWYFFQTSTYLSLFDIPLLPPLEAPINFGMLAPGKH